MLISIKKRFIFIANSKTSSTSIEAALTPYAEINRSGSPQRKHINWINARREYDFLFKIPAYKPEKFFKFGVVREPAEWVISWYNYRNEKPSRPNSLPSDMGFEQFWDSNDWIKRSSQKSHFSNKNNICKFNLIIPQEKINQVFPVVAKHLKCDKAVLPHKNKTLIKKIYRENIDTVLIDRINNYYMQDFHFWLEWMEKIDDSLKNFNI